MTAVVQGRDEPDRRLHHQTDPLRMGCLKIVAFKLHGTSYKDVNE